MAEQQQQKQLQIKFTDEDIKGRYSNMMQVMHRPEEFVLDFLNVSPPAGALVSRVIVSPGHLKRMVVALSKNLDMYEKQFGKVKEAEGPDVEIGFRP